MERSCADTHHGIISLAAPRTLASSSGNPSERGARPADFTRRKPVPFVITSAGGGERASRFQETVGLCFPAWNASVSGPKPAFHRATTAIHWESQCPCCWAIMGQLSIGAGFHTFLLRAHFHWADLLYYK